MLCSVQTKMPRHFKGCYSNHSDARVLVDAKRLIVKYFRNTSRPLSSEALLLRSPKQKLVFGN